MVLVWSAMRHFAADLRDQGWTVDYIQTETFSSALLAWIQEQGIQELRLMEPVDRGFRRSIERVVDAGVERATAPQLERISRR